MPQPPVAVFNQNEVRVSKPAPKVKIVLPTTNVSNRVKVAPTITLNMKMMKPSRNQVLKFNTTNIVKFGEMKLKAN